MSRILASKIQVVISWMCQLTTIEKTCSDLEHRRKDGLRRRISEVELLNSLYEPSINFITSLK